MISGKSYLYYKKKAIKKTVTDEDVLKLIKDGVLDFEKLNEIMDQIDSNSEIIYCLSDIKSQSSRFAIGMHKHKHLKCEKPKVISFSKA